MQQSTFNPDTVGRELTLPTKRPRPKLLDQLRQALRSRDGIHTIRGPLDHKEVSTTMIYAHAFNKGGSRVAEPDERNLEH